MNLAEFQGSRASTQLAMGRPRDAEATFKAAARAFDGGAVRTHALYLARQADAQWRQGHHEEACVTAHRSMDLTDQISSHRTVGPLQDLVGAGRAGPERKSHHRQLNAAPCSLLPAQERQTIGGRPARVRRHTVRHDIGRRSPPPPPLPFSRLRNGASGLRVRHDFPLLLLMIRGGWCHRARRRRRTADEGLEHRLHPSRKSSP